MGPKPAWGWRGRQKRPHSRAGAKEEHLAPRDRSARRSGGETRLGESLHVAKSRGLRAMFGNKGMPGHLSHRETLWGVPEAWGDATARSVSSCTMMAGQMFVHFCVRRPCPTTTSAFERGRSGNLPKLGPARHEKYRKTLFPPKTVFGSSGGGNRNVARLGLTELGVGRSSPTRPTPDLVTRPRQIVLVAQVFV